ncbi:MAG: acyl-CoA carboxylase subunit beta [Longilinea sp.]|jgi:propionyl-CoA carboxylase beta chain|nr:acyl-CoA carboxylase subunit beta [Longilinea sp.]
MPVEDPRILALREMRAKARLGGGEERIAAQHAKGKLTARERLEQLLDPGTFQELEPFVVQGHDETNPDFDKILGDGVVTGFGRIDGRLVYAYSQDFTVQGGSLGEMQSHRICAAMDAAVRAGAPVIGLIDSGGARIQEGVRSLGGYAEIFRRNALYSGIIPQISVIMGPCAGGASYSPALTDIIIMVEKSSYMFLTGPDVIKTVTGEVVDQETLGGAATHHSVSGLAHLTAADESGAFAEVRRVLSYLPQNHVENPPFVQTGDDANRMDEALNQLVPIDPSAPYSMHDAIEYIVDRGSFTELLGGFARNAIVGLARMGGMSVGIVSQEPDTLGGSIDIDASDKITRFVRFCDCYNIPIVTFVDSPGFIPGTDQEYRGIIRHGAKVLYAYAEASVPKISIVTRKAYGGAYVVMSSKYMGTDICYAWPSAEIAVMGADGAANIVYRRQIKEAADPAAERARLVEEYRQRFCNPYAAANAGYIDEVIEPRETRSRVIAALIALRDKTVQALPRKHGNMPV